MTANALYIVETTVTVAGVRYQKGQTVALTAAQVTAIGAANLRAVVQNIVAPAVPAMSASQTHDTLGEAAGVSNSS